MIESEFEQIIVTRHRMLGEHLIERGLVHKDVPIYSHISAKEIIGKHVIGILPFHLACHAALYTEIPLRVPYEKKSTELTLSEIRFYMQQPRTYKIVEIKREDFK